MAVCWAVLTVDSLGKQRVVWMVVHSAATRVYWMVDCSVVCLVGPKAKHLAGTRADRWVYPLAALWVVA